VGTDGTFNSLKVTGNQTNGTLGYCVNIYWGTAATMSTDGVPLGSIYLQTGTASTSDYAGTAGVATFATSSGQSGTALKATSAGNAGTAMIAGTANYATSSGASGTALFATSAGNAGTSFYATSSGNSGTAFFATSAGNCGTAQVFAAPFIQVSSVTNQTAGTVGDAYTAFYEIDEIKSGITHSTAGGSNYRIQIDTAGTYLISFSAIARVTTPSKTFEIWLAVDDVDVPRSNTKSLLPTANVQRCITVTYIYTFTAGQYFTLKYTSDDSGAYMIATGTAASPARPASPSIIVTAQRIA
jgi:hypothetical protein